MDGSEANLIYEALLLQRQEAETKGDFDAYVSVEERLQKLEEFEAVRLERQARILEAQVRIQAAQRMLKDKLPVDQTESLVTSWTEDSLKVQFKTLKAVRDALGITAKSWKAAADQANQQGASK